ncbi:MAG: phosphoenolpyruvate carboxykinase (ATP), partial [Bacilli bacterium]
MQTEHILSRLQTLINNNTSTQKLTPHQLVEAAIKNNEGALTQGGALAVKTGKYTGRSPFDRYFVLDEYSQNAIGWSNTNQPMGEEDFLRLAEQCITYAEQLNTRYVFTGSIGANPNHSLAITAITEYAWHNLFAYNMFIPDAMVCNKNNVTSYTILFLPNMKATPDCDDTNLKPSIVISLKYKIILISGTGYAGEMKKAMFTVQNILLPEQGVLPMHCSANVGEDGDTALFFGLSGTGKTTLSTCEHRKLIGDDEHGWSKDGIFNFEGGCYAKVIDLDEKKEPEVSRAIRFGSVLENVVLDDFGYPLYNDRSITENTRVAYPLSHLQHVQKSGTADAPKTIIFLTADAFGVLPPVAKLTKNQALYHFLSGYTSKLAGTEQGITEPIATFSTCFGEPFMPLAPERYASLLLNKLEASDVNVWLINTGWTAGVYGTGYRIPLHVTRRIVDACIS